MVTVLNDFLVQAEATPELYKQLNQLLGQYASTDEAQIAEAIASDCNLSPFWRALASCWLGANVSRASEDRSNDFIQALAIISSPGVHRAEVDYIHTLYYTGRMAVPGERDSPELFAVVTRLAILAGWFIAPKLALEMASWLRELGDDAGSRQLIQLIMERAKSPNHFSQAGLVRLMNEPHSL